MVALAGNYPVSAGLFGYLTNIHNLKQTNMGNMSHCRFENTYKDLQDCHDALTEAGSIEELEENANQYEKKYIRKLIKLCKDIADEFQDELED